MLIGMLLLLLLLLLQELLQVLMLQILLRQPGSGDRPRLSVRFSYTIIFPSGHCCKRMGTQKVKPGSFSFWSWRWCIGCTIVGHGLVAIVVVGV
jgi:hypothetical protein